jgi:hypothetical protein
MLNVVAVVSAVVLLATYLTWLAGRLDRLHARTDGARASLDAQLVRRAASAMAVAEYAVAAGLLSVATARALSSAARVASTAGVAERESAENDLSRSLHTAVPLLGQRDADLRGLLADLAAACSHVVLARRFYNDAVRDTRSVRRRRLVRWLRLSGHAPTPGYFEIDDTPTTALTALDPAQPT